MLNFNNDYSHRYNIIKLTEIINNPSLFYDIMSIRILCRYLIYPPPLPRGAAGARVCVGDRGRAGRTYIRISEGAGDR